MKEQIIDLVIAISKLVDLNYRELNSAEIAFACEAVAQGHRELLFQHMRERQDELKGASVDKLEISTRSRNALWHEGIQTIAQLEQMTDGELLRLPNFGRKCLRDIKQGLASYRSRVRNGAVP